MDSEKSSINNAQKLDIPPLNLVDRISKAVSSVNGFIITVIAFALVICVTWQVIARYIFSSPSTVTDELARFLFMWVGLLGAAQASALKQHLAIDLMYMKLKGLKRRILCIFIESCVIFFSAVVMIRGGWMLTAKTFASKQITPALQIPMGYIYLVVPVAGALLVFFALVSIYHIVHDEMEA